VSDSSIIDTVLGVAIQQCQRATYVIENVTKSFFGGRGGENTTVGPKIIQVTPTTRPYVIERYDRNSCKKVSIRWPTGVGWGIMYRACHIVSLPHVFTLATSFKYPTCDTAGTNSFYIVGNSVILPDMTQRSPL
jgi:hypothetical protein